MKKILIFTLIGLLVCGVGFADTKASDLDAISSPIATDELYVIDDPGGTPASKNITIGNLFAVATDLDTNGVISADSVALTTDTTGNYAAGDAEAGSALSGDAAENFFGAGVSAVTDATVCTDLEGTLLSITAGTLNATEVDGSTTNEINTIQGDDDVATSGLAISIYGAGTVTTDVVGDVLTITGSAHTVETNSLETTITGIADTEFFVGNGADSGAFVTMSSEATMANTGAVTLADSVAVTSWNLTTSTMTGISILADAATWLWDFVLASDETQTGITSSQTMGTTVAHGDVVYLAAADSRWELADASAAASSFGLAMALGAGSDGNPTTVLHYGVVRQDTDWNWTVGTPIYLTITGTTTNTLSQTPPSGNGEQVVVVGYALTADSMFFNPSLVLVEVVA